MLLHLLPTLAVFKSALGCHLTPILVFVGSSFSFWDQHPGGSSRRRLRRHLGAARYLCGGAVLQEEAHGERHRAAFPRARVEGHRHVVRAGDEACLLIFLLGWCGVWLAVGFQSDGKEKKGRKKAWKASFHPCLLLQRKLSSFSVITFFLHVFIWFYSDSHHSHHEVLNCRIGVVNMEGSLKSSFFSLLIFSSQQ